MIHTNISIQEEESTASHRQSEYALPVPVENNKPWQSLQELIPLKSREARSNGHPLPEDSLCNHRNHLHRQVRQCLHQQDEKLKPYQNFAQTPESYERSGEENQTRRGEGSLDV